ncbi:8175_t:CDS:2 [Rhizophagus irregularis]|nr:8175_t:CDS:2 [Rhizophagus irregularis]
MTDIGEVSHQKSSSEEEEEAEDVAHRILYDPQKWPYIKKYRILFLVALPAFLTPLSNTSLYPAISDMKEEFEATAIIINLLLGIYIIFRGIAPIFWSSYSDQLKTRKRVYLASLLIYTMSNIICGFAKNAIILVLFGIIQSIGISAALSLGGGTVSDVFIPAERGKAYAIYLVGYFIALASGPNIGDLITNSLGWRWVFYILAILGSATLLLITSFLPETFREPEENLYLLFAYISPPVGYLIGSFIAGIYSDRLAGYESDVETRKEREMKKEEKKRLMKEETTEIMQEILENRDIIYRFPVMRIYVAFYSSLIVPLFIVTYGWLTQIKVHILIPLIISFIAGIGLQGQSNCISTYLIDANPGKSASALALSDFISYFFVAILIVLVNPLVDLIGMGFTYTIMAFFSILSIILLVIVFKNDERWRGVNL